MNILFIESDQSAEYNSSNWRCVIPMRALRRAGHTANLIRLEEWNSRSENARQLTEAADIVFVQRNLFSETLDTIFYWTAKRKVLVGDLDDSYKDMTEETGSPSYAWWKKGVLHNDNDNKDYKIDPMPLDMLTYGVKMCAGVSSPSKLICKDWSGVARTYWFPNYVDLALYYRKTVRRDPGSVHFGWGGSQTHLVSWQKSGAADAVSQIINENPHVQIVLLGDPRCERFFAVKPSSRLSHKWIPQATFAGGLSSFDIGLIPLYGEYDRRRSWIKTMEYSVMGIPWVGSDMEPTQDVDTGTRVENTTAAWYKTLKFYVENVDALQDAAAANIEASRERFDIDHHVGELVTLFEKIIKEAK